MVRGRGRGGSAPPPPPYASPLLLHFQPIVSFPVSVSVHPSNLLVDPTETTHTYCPPSGTSIVSGSESVLQLTKSHWYPILGQSTKKHGNTFRLTPHGQIASFYSVIKQHLSLRSMSLMMPLTPSFVGPLEDVVCIKSEK